jgi:hypothetical protein
MFARRAAKYLVFSTILTSSALAAGQDDSVWINQGIQQAIDNGAAYYQLPAGIIRLQNNIIIPPGTKNFALIGAGIDQTIIKAPVARTKFIDVGDQIIPHNNWGLTNKQNSTVLAVAEGTRTIRLAAGQPVIAPGKYVLWDEHVIRNRYGGGDTHNRAEIVNVLWYNISNRTATLEQPVGRKFNVNPKLAHYGAALCQNITISGMTLDGLSDAGEGSQSLLSINSVLGLNVNNIRLVNYSNGAMYVNVCKNSTITNVIIDPATQGGVGSGYGLTVTRSRFTRIANSVANWSQAIKFHTGAMDSIVEDCVTTAGGNAIDAHGFDELRVTVRRCTGNGGITLGNEAWSAGGAGHVVQDCDLQFLFIGPNVDKLLVKRSTFEDPLSLSDLDPASCDINANPRGGIPGDLRFEDCSFSGNQNVVNDFAWYNVFRATFIRCTFSTRNTSWGSVIKLSGARGILQFLQCEFVPAANREAIEIATGSGNKLTLVMDRCTIRSNVGLDIGVWLRPTFQGRVSLTNNRLLSPGAPQNSVFLKNEGNARGSMRNNYVQR